MCQAQHIVSHFIFTMNPMEAGILLSPFYRWGNESPEKLRNLHKVTWLLPRKSEIYPILSNDTLPLNKHPFTPHAKLSAVLRTQQWAKEKLFLTSGNPKISRNLWASTSNPQLNKKKTKTLNSEKVSNLPEATLMGTAKRQEPSFLALVTALSIL